MNPGWHAADLCAVAAHGFAHGSSRELEQQSAQMLREVPRRRSDGGPNGVVCHEVAATGTSSTRLPRDVLPARALTLAAVGAVVGAASAEVSMWDRQSSTNRSDGQLAGYAAATARFREMWAALDVETVVNEFWGLPVACWWLTLQGVSNLPGLNRVGYLYGHRPGGLDCCESAKPRATRVSVHWDPALVLRGHRDGFDLSVAHAAVSAGLPWRLVASWVSSSLGASKLRACLRAGLSVREVEAIVLGRNAPNDTVLEFLAGLQ